ncbi:MAG: hypothetical protein LBT68_05055 [Spirochaetales bacterium]|nr:hypothetical protein [Spirochaetales bacterium]
MVLFTALIFTVAAADPVVTVVNGTGTDMYYLYIGKSDEWSDDLLDDDIIEPGESFQTSLPAGTWDISFEDEDGYTYTKYEVRITRDTVIKITEDDEDDE